MIDFGQPKKCEQRSHALRDGWFAGGEAEPCLEAMSAGVPYVTHETFFPSLEIASPLPHFLDRAAVVYEGFKIYANALLNCRARRRTSWVLDRAARCLEEPALR